MQIKSLVRALRVYDLPDKKSLHLAGFAISRDLSEEEIGCESIQKALARKWARTVIVKAQKTVPTTPVAKPAKPVVEADPNVSSDE